MSMLELLKQKLLQARKSGQSLEMAVLQVVLGEASMIEARTGKKASDDELEKVIRKTMLGNQETLTLLQQKGQAESENFTKLTSENQFLQSLLPATLSVDEIVSQLGEVAEAIRTAKGDGQATGVAMKHLKSKNSRVLGEDVSQAVKKLRG